MSDRLARPGDPVEVHRAEALLEAVGAMDVQAFLQLMLQRHKAQAPAVVAMMAVDLLLHLTPPNEWGGPPVRIAGVPIASIAQRIVSEGPKAARSALQTLAIEMSLAQTKAETLRTAQAWAVEGKQ